jgi:two-component system chemotaxis response regulator CheB
MEPRKIKVLIVDDSVLFRSQIQLALKDIPEIEVVGTAANGRTAIERLKHLEVDVCTLDIEMPVLDGLETLKELRALNLKTRVIMFSSLTVSGADKTLEAMRLGAVDFVTKPLAEDARGGVPAQRIRDALLPKILSLFPGVAAPKPRTAVAGNFSWDLFFPEVLVIAASTGGPNALIEYFALLREPLPYPILVTQHMPPLFTAPLAERIGNHSGKVAREAVHGEPLVANQIYIAPGNYHLSIGGSRRAPHVILDQTAPRNFVRPCADFLFESAAAIYGRSTLGVVFTGMGRDGADGAAAVKAARGAVLVQDEESCVVFGMPGAVTEEGNFDFTGSPSEIAHKTLNVSRIRSTGNVA